MRLGDLDALKEALSNNEAIRIFNLHYDGLIAELIDKAPTVTPDKIQAIMSDYLVYRCEPQRPQGEWKFKKFDEKTGIPNSYWCPFCGMVKMQVYDNFCGNCGAKMGGET